MGNLNGILSSEDKRYRDKLQDNGRIYMAEVMDTRSPLKIGDLKVWIINTNSNKKDPSNWITAKCVSPVYGCTSNKEDISDDENISFGWWNPMPYVGNYVFVFFPNLIGGNSECYWFGSPMDVSNVMLPGISYDLTNENNVDYKPVCDKNYLKTKKAQNDNNKNNTNPLNNTLNIGDNLGIGSDLLGDLGNISDFGDITNLISKDMIDSAVSMGLSAGITAMTGGAVPPMVTDMIVSKVKESVTKKVNQKLNNGNGNGGNNGSKKNGGNNGSKKNGGNTINGNSDILNSADITLPINMESIEGLIKGALKNLDGNSLNATAMSNAIMKSINNQNKPKEYKVLSKALKEQGLDEDRFRGISTASSFRETPSRCYGFLSPLGNQFVIDDGWVAEGEKQSWIENPKKKQEGKYDDKAMHTEKDDYGVEHNKKQWKAEINESGKDDKLNRFHGGFRFRTRNGTQLLILDCGTIYMINKDGSAWVELSNDGYIDCYSKAGISATSDGDINFYAKKDINLECENQIRMSSKKGILMETPGNINANSGSFNSSAHISVETIEANTGVINSLKSSNAEINGIFSGSLQGTAYYATYAGREPVEQEKPNVKEQIQIPETTKIKKHKTNTKQKKNPVNKETVVSRRPLHEPWEEHNKNDFIPKLNSIGKPNNKSKNEKNNSINNSQNKSELTVNNNLVGQNNGNKS